MNLFRYYHSPATFAFRDRGLTVQMILPDEEKDLETVSLAFVVEGNSQSGTLRMLPVDGLVLEESYSVYAATVGADVLRDGERLTYRFLREGDRKCLPRQGAGFYRAGMPRGRHRGKRQCRKRLRFAGRF